MLVFFFFFQAEDGIRDVAVTGVQTCALPISESARSGARRDDTKRTVVAGAAARPHDGDPGRFFWLVGAAPDRDGNLRSDCLCGRTPDQREWSASGIGRNAAERSADDCARDTDARRGGSDIWAAARPFFYPRAQEHA